MLTGIRRALAVLIMTLGIAFGVMPSAAAVPQLMNYQGQLTDGNGEPLATGEYKLTFKLWNHATESEAEHLGWTEVHDSVPAVRGQFNVILGGTTSLEGKLEGATRSSAPLPRPVLFQLE